MRRALASSSEDYALVTGRRSAPRLRLSIPARLVTLYETRRCVLLNLSQTGAQIGLEDPLSEGDGAFLKVAGLDHFGGVVRKGPGTNALEFDVSLSENEVLSVRRYSECFEEDERRRLRREVRAWVHGSK